MKLQVTAEHEDEIYALVGWMKLSLFNENPALSKFEVNYLDYFDDGNPKTAIIDLEFLEPSE